MGPNDTQLPPEPPRAPAPAPLPARRMDPRLWALLPIVALLILGAYFLGKYLNAGGAAPVTPLAPVTQAPPPPSPRGKMSVTEVPHSITVTPITPPTAPPPAPSVSPRPNPTPPFKQEEPAVVLPSQPDDTGAPGDSTDATPPDNGRTPPDENARPGVTQPNRDPVKLNDPAQEYPTSAYEEGVEGTTRVDFTITEDGNVTDAQIGESSGDSRLDQAALDYVKRLKFRPAIRDGQPTAVRADRNVRFSLQ